MRPLISICITIRNNVTTLGPSLTSILAQVDERFEVVVVDSLSSDGSTEMLKGFVESHGIKLIVEGCTRGRGRQIAFENSTGASIVANLDMDEVYGPQLAYLFRFCVEKTPEKMLAVLNDGDQDVTIASRGLIEEIGGWRDVNYGEDWDIWRRAADRGLFTSVIFPLIPKPNAHADRGKTIPRMRYRYTRYLATLVLGRDTFHEEKAVTPSQKFVYLMALVVSAFKKKQTHPPSAEFVPQSDEYRISFDMRDLSSSSQKRP